MKKRVLGSFILASLLGGLLTGCGGSSSSNNDSSTTDTTTQEKSSSGKVTKAGFLGYSADSGTLTALTNVEAVSGKRNLLSVYMVGSDLESNHQAGTTDLKEMIQGYYTTLTDEERAKLDIVVAFGGVDKDGWRGMKIADIEQIQTDSLDNNVFGNSGDYYYEAAGAHMGDSSSFQLFLEFLKQKYPDHDNTYLMMWDHGASYGMFGNDENFGGDGLTLAEISKGFTDAQVEKVDVLGFDACLNGSLEVANMAEPYADYLLGSEELEPGHGWNWEAVVSSIAKEDNVTVASKNIIDNFVQDVHEYQSDGKTLSIVDLSKLTTLREKLDDVFGDINDNMFSDQELKSAVLEASKEVQDFGKNEQEGTRVSIDLIHFLYLVANKISDSDLKTKISSEILDYIGEEFVIHSNTDGTRNALGVSIVPIEGASNYSTDVAFSTKWSSLITTYQTIKNGDTSAPEVLEQDFNVEYADLDFDWNWESEFDWSDYEYEDDNDISLSSITAQKIKARSFQAPKNTAPFLSGERMAFVAPQGVQLRATSSVQGSVVKFSDSNLADVNTLYGNIIDNTFLTTAGVEAYETTTDGQYFTPNWNQSWYTVQYDAGSETMWLPMELEERLTKDGQEYVRYSTEIDYIDSSKDYSKYTQESGKFDYGRLEITVDSNNTIISHSIRTYKYVYSSAEDTVGHVLFDKVTSEIKVGDQLAFYSKGIDLATKEVFWNLEGDFITFTQLPEFFVEELSFVDDNDQPLEYYSMMVAEDISNNMSFSTPVKTSSNYNSIIDEIIYNQSCVNCNLAGVDFKDANLSGVDFTGADLSNANFSLADTQGAIFTNATTTGTKF